MPSKSRKPNFKAMLAFVCEQIEKSKSVDENFAWFVNQETRAWWLQYKIDRANATLDAELPNRRKKKETHE